MDKDKLTKCWFNSRKHCVPVGKLITNVFKRAHNEWIVLHFSKVSKSNISIIQFCHFHSSSVFSPVYCLGFHECQSPMSVVTPHKAHETKTIRLTMNLTWPSSTCPSSIPPPAGVTCHYRASFFTLNFYSNKTYNMYVLNHCG